MMSENERLEDWKALAIERGKAIKEFLKGCDDNFEAISEIDPDTAVEFALYDITVGDLKALMETIQGDSSL